MTDLAPYTRMIERLSARVDTKPVFRWATVTNISPLLIQLDGDPAPLLGSPSNAGPKVYLVGERVRVELQNGRATVHTAANRVEDVRGTTAQRIDLALSGVAVPGMRFYDTDENREYVWGGGAWVAQVLNSSGTTAQRAEITPMFGDIWKDTDANGYVWKGSSTGVWRRLSGLEHVPAGAWQNSGNGIYARTVGKNIPTVLEASETVLTSPVGVGTGYGSISLSGITEINWATLTTHLGFRHYHFLNNTVNSFYFAWQIIDV